MKKINESELERKFNKVIGEKNIDFIKDILIVQLSDNTYSLYGKYIIKRIEKDSFNIETNDEIIANFCNIKNAVAWCMFDKTNRLHQAKRVQSLDKSLISINVDMTIHEKMYKKAKDSETKLMYLAKLTEDKYKQKTVINELSSYINQTKTWNYNRLKTSKT